MAQRTIVITGASSGIGKATAKHFADNGWNVAATMRSPENESDLTAYDNVKLYRLDVTEQDSIDAARSEILDDLGKVDVLLNNAGYGLFGPFELLTDEQMRREFDVNVFGLFNVTRAFIPHLRENREGIVINVSSMGGVLAFPLISSYNSTKFAVEGFSMSLSYELREFGVRVKLIEPGNIRTDFGGRSLDSYAGDSTDAYEPLFERASSLSEEISDDIYSEPGIVAEAIFEAATDGEDRIRYVVGEDAEEYIALRMERGDDAFLDHVWGMYSRGAR